MNMEITQNVTKKALEILQYEGISGLPKPIGRSPFFLAVANDESVLAHGAVEFDNVEYKIGTKK